MSYVFTINSDESLQRGLIKALHIISEGGIVAFPTESFYGLGVDATNTDAVKNLFQIKKRDLNSPILILISSLRDLPRYVAYIPSQAKKLGKKFWPGGLTMVFQSSPVVSSLLTSSTGRIGIRISSHPIAYALSKTLHAPITATSANVSGKPPCISADQVLECFKNTIDLILDGGKTQGKYPSTILDVTSDPPRIIRKGIVKVEEIIESGIYKEIHGNT